MWTACSSQVAAQLALTADEWYVCVHLIARLISGARHHDHITPVLASLHWLPVRQWVVFKMAVLVWKCLHGVAPHYLANLCVPVASEEGRQCLHSAASGVLMVPRARTSIGQRSVAIQGPATWNSLPVLLLSLDMTLRVFRHELKTHLFQC